MKKDKNVESIDNGNKQYNKMGIISFIVSIVGMFVAGLPCGFAAVVTGIMGLAKFNNEEEKGKWMAIAGLVIGILDAILTTIYIALRSVGVTP